MKSQKQLCVKCMYIKYSNIEISLCSGVEDISFANAPNVG